MPPSAREISGMTQTKPEARESGEPRMQLSGGGWKLTKLRPSAANSEVPNSETLETGNRAAWTHLSFALFVLSGSEAYWMGSTHVLKGWFFLTKFTGTNANLFQKHPQRHPGNNAFQPLSHPYLKSIPKITLAAFQRASSFSTLWPLFCERSLRPQQPLQGPSPPFSPT